MKVSLLGPVGSGKGTQAHLVLGKLNYARISTGDLVRGQLEADTELGRELKGHSDQGEPVLDETIMELVRPHLQPAGAWILDACTRTIEQARTLDEELKERSGGLDQVIVLEGPSNEELIERITSGKRHSLATGRVYHLEHDPPTDSEEGEDPGPFVQREDDTEEAIRRQIEAYFDEAEANKKRYGEQGILTVVDADQDPQKVTEDIIEALGDPQRR
jgi:adenylate kinase